MAVVSLKGKVALVTGSARRVGKFIALELARQGMHQVIHHGNSDQEAAETATEIRALGVDAIVVKADLSQPVQIEQLFAAIRQHYGRLDLLVNSASSFKSGSILDVPLEDWQEALDVNMTAPLLCSQHAARMMIERGEGGAIINITDMSAFQPWKAFPQHSISKAGMVMLTEVLALSLAPSIRVNAIAPGPVLRDQGNSPEKWEQIGRRLPMGRTGEPGDVAQAVVFLATQTFVTGVTLQVNGGEHLI